ncbi:hypothetical protein RJT34_10947 [Clitoria ternatea]|uniref:Uncharacterized protein n=1 Tax=Clitoria ternatea TaxID=43366 RepID=A0AAN9JJK4_CLITE
MYVPIDNDICSLELEDMADENRNEVAIEIKEKLEKAQPILTSDCCIYRVPNAIRELKPEAYTPKVVSIGPFHHRSPRLQNMECQKQIDCKKFIERAETSMENLVKCVQELEPKVRRSYADNIDEFSVKELVELILVDSGFLFVFFLKHYFPDEWRDNNPSFIPFTQRLTSSIYLDILLLENQLPFFALEKLYNVAFPSRHHPSLAKLVFRFYGCHTLIPEEASLSMKHFTDLLRMSQIPPRHIQPARVNILVNHLYSITALHSAGVKFTVNKESMYYTQLKFTGRNLQIPLMDLSGYTEPILRNVIALEQCHYPFETLVTEHAILMDYLINTSKDVDILIENGIIKNMLGDNTAVSNLFNGLCRKCVASSFNSDYVGISKELNAYYDNAWNKKKAALRRDYCNTPWQTVATIAGIVLLILTVTQTYVPIDNDIRNLELEDMADENRNEVAIEIKEKLEKAQPILTGDCCIYRVPNEIRELKPEAYTPKVVSIGPFHHRSPRLQNMECQKQIDCKKFIERAETSMENLVKCVQELEPKVRRSYADNIDEFSVKELVELILVDSGFLFVLFLKNYFPDEWRDNNPISTPFTHRLMSCIYLDIHLLENQLPFFALEKLYNVAFPSRHHPSLAKLVFRYFGCHTLIPEEASLSMKHFTDLFRMIQIPPRFQPARVNTLINHLYSITALHSAGVKFTVNKETMYYIQLKFSGRNLQIPLMQLSGSSEPILRNVIALEQCHYPFETLVTEHAILMDYLINTSKDVDILIENGIIKNMLGDNTAVSNLFNGLCRKCVVSSFNSDYVAISKGLNAYYENAWNRKKAALRRDYCNTPWQTVATIAGIVLLILTVTQTVCSVIQLI